MNYALPEGFVPITLQHIFNLAYQKFVVENAPLSLNEDGECVYLTEDRKKCGVGLAIPDGHPAQLEQGGFSTLFNMYPELWDYHSIYDQLDLIEASELTVARALNAFQAKIHDDIVFNERYSIPHNRKELYEKVAIEYGFTLPK